MQEDGQIFVGEALIALALCRIAADAHRPDIHFTLRHRTDGMHVLEFAGEAFEIPEWAGVEKGEALAMMNILIGRSLPPDVADKFEPIREVT